jgi:hypothetical protein
VVFASGVSIRHFLQTFCHHLQSFISGSVFDEKEGKHGLCAKQHEIKIAEIR